MRQKSEKSRFQVLMDDKTRNQEEKEAAIRNMSEADWELAQKNFKKARAEGRMPPKMTSRRRYKEP